MQASPHSLFLDDLNPLLSLQYHSVQDDSSQGETPITTPLAHILIVDDQPDNLRLLSTMLESQGYRVRKAINGDLALKGAFLDQPDLILLDINMPGLNGYQVCQTLKQQSKTCHIPVIFVSAFDQAFDKVRAFETGGVDYITKPFQIEEVLIRVENQLRQKHLAEQLRRQNLRLQQEIQEHRRAEAEVRFLLTTSQDLNQALDTDAAYGIALERIGQITQSCFGEVWLPDSQDTTLIYHPIGPETFPQHPWHQLNQDRPLAPQQGIPGQIWRSGQLQWIADLSHCSLEEPSRKTLALTLGWVASLGIPVIFNQQVLAVLCFLKSDHQTPEARVLNLVQAVANQLSSLLQRKKAEIDLMAANVKLKHLATIDGLTGIANRRQFDDFLAVEWRRLARDQQPLSLILCDVDFFKRYNDYYGHLAGDFCLQQVAQTIQTLVKRPADLVARYGGEEFAIILPKTSFQGAVHIAESVRQAVQLLQIDHAQSGVSPYVTLSLGVTTVLPTQQTPLEQLIQCTDQALYLAKKQGRNQVVGHHDRTLN